MILDEDKGTSLPSSCAILGSTGSVGEQALEVAEAENIPVSLLTARRDVEKMEAQIRRFSPRVAVMTEEHAARDLADRVRDTGTRVLSGMEAIGESLDLLRPPVVINSILGEAGLAPTLWALETGCRLGLANKESIVVAGDLVMRKEKECGAKIVPVDSEHSAIFQCLSGGRQEEISRIFLTASGGPFFGYTKEQLRGVTREQTLAHPTWRMGQKITVDSADLMNKGFEVIEAVRLFHVRPEQIRVLIHRESILHSAVEYIDHAVIGQMGVPDMRLCVQYAMSWPRRVAGPVKELDLISVGKLTFAEPDTTVFPLLALAFSCVKAGGGMTAVLNAANEVAVSAFLNGRISFYEIAEVVQSTVSTHSAAAGAATLEEIMAYDKKARGTAALMIR